MKNILTIINNTFNRVQQLEVKIHEILTEYTQVTKYQLHSHDLSCLALLVQCNLECHIMS